MITRLDPNDVPIWQTIEHTKTRNSTHQWLTDTFATGVDNKAIDGADATAVQATGRTKLTNHTQILQKTFQVSGTIDAEAQYGLNTESGYQMRKNTKELIHDVEFALIKNASASGASGTAREMDGMLTFITSEVSAHTAAAVLTAADTALELAYNNVLQGIFENGGQPTRTYVTGLTKRRFSTFTTRVTRNIDASERRMVTSIEVYQSDFGTQQVIPHRQMTTTVAMIIDPEFWSIPILRAINVNKLAKTGDSTKWQILGEMTLEARAEAANGKLTALATALP